MMDLLSSVSPYLINVSVGSDVVVVKCSVKSQVKYLYSAKS